MIPDYLQRQSPDKPLFPDLLWSRPENKLHAGKLTIIGGNAHGFAAPALAFTEAGKAGAGSVRVVLPEHVQKLLPKGFFEADFAPSTPSGSFAKESLATLIEHAAWADATLIAGDLGRNSETAIVLEQFATKYTGPLVVTQDAADYFINTAESTLHRANTTLVISFAQLRKLGIAAKTNRAFTFAMDFVPLVEALHDFTAAISPVLIVKHNETIFVAANGQVSATKLPADLPIWRVTTAAHAAVWWLQNQSDIYKALTTSLAEASTH